MWREEGHRLNGIGQFYIPCHNRPFMIHYLNRKMHLSSVRNRGWRNSQSQELRSTLLNYTFRICGSFIVQDLKALRHKQKSKSILRTLAFGLINYEKECLVRFAISYKTMIADLVKHCTTRTGNLVKSSRNSDSN